MSELVMHDLKIESCYFDAILSGEKTWELRKNDRNFRCGDLLCLHEINHNGDFTGRTCVRVVKYVYCSCRGINHGLCAGYCIMSIDKCDYND